jgi:hypothetical protein
MPFGTLLADDAIWLFRMHGTGPTRRHMLQGGQDSLPWKQPLKRRTVPPSRGLRQRARLEEPDRGRRQLRKGLAHDRSGRPRADGIHSAGTVGRSGSDVSLGFVEEEHCRPVLVPMVSGDSLPGRQGTPAFLCRRALAVSLSRSLMRTPPALVTSRLAARSSTSARVRTAWSAAVKWWPMAAEKASRQRASSPRPAWLRRAKVPNCDVFN